MLDFINCDFSEYEALRLKVMLYFEEHDERLDEYESDSLGLCEKIEIVKKTFPDFKPLIYDSGEQFWDIELKYYLLEHYPTFYGFFDNNLLSIQREHCADFASLQIKVLNKAKAIFDVDYYYDFYGQYPELRNNFNIFGETRYQNAFASLSPMQRLSLFSHDSTYYPFSKPDFSLHEKVFILPNQSMKISNRKYANWKIPFLADGEEIDDEYKKELLNEYAQEVAHEIEYIKNNSGILTGYEFATLEDAYECEMFKMAQAGISLKRCENCGKYFIFNPNKPARYCNNKLPNINMTCQQIAPQKKYNANLSPIQKAYINALKNENKKYHSKKSGSRTPNEDKIYEKWKQKNSEIKLEYQKKYDDAKTDTQKNNILDEFKKKLNS